MIETLMFFVVVEVYWALSSSIASRGESPRSGPRAHDDSRCHRVKGYEFGQSLMMPERPSVSVEPMSLLLISPPSKFRVGRAPYSPICEATLHLRSSIETQQSYTPAFAVSSLSPLRFPIFCLAALPYRSMYGPAYKVALYLKYSTA